MPCHFVTQTHHLLLQRLPCRQVSFCNTSERSISTDCDPLYIPVETKSYLPLLIATFRKKTPQISSRSLVRSGATLLKLIGGKQYLDFEPDLGHIHVEAQ